MRQWKKILALGLGFTLTFGQAAYAEIIVPPISTIGAAENGGGAGDSSSVGAPEILGNNGTLAVPGGVGTSSAAGNAGTSSAPGTGAVLGDNGTSAQPGGGTGSAGGVTGQGPGAGTGTGTTPSGTEVPSSAGAAELQDPVVVAEGAVLLDASTGRVLYGKNQDKQFFPASITKIMTALLVLERCDLNDKVTFSATATTNLESGAVSLNITEGDVLTVEQCLYGLLLKSANEIGNGLAEHVAGSVSGFADLMNEKAKALGCKNTHFANPHGLNDSTHKTTPYDMALIMRAALENAAFRKIDTTTSYNFPATKKSAARTITMGHKMMYPSDSRYYEGIIGGKTGYTSLAGNTLVTAVEKNGVRLIAVVMKAKSTQYTDTKAMLDYGFEHYAVLTGQNGSGGGNAAGPSAAAGEQGVKSSQNAQNVKGVQGSQGGASGNASAGWKQDASGWYYIKEDGAQAASEWKTLDGSDYWFDGNGYMATGWRKFTNGAWYYFAPENGRMVYSNWVQDGGAWYYLGADGVLLTNTTTPDGNKVDENGIWFQQ